MYWLTPGFAATTLSSCAFDFADSLDDFGANDTFPIEVSVLELWLIKVAALDEPIEVNKIANVVKTAKSCFLFLAGTNFARNFFMETPINPF